MQVSEGGPLSEGNGSETPGNLVPPDGDLNANGGGASGNGTNAVASAGTGGNGTDAAGILAAGATADSGEAVANNGNAAGAEATPAPIDSAAKPDTRALVVPQAPSYLAAKTSLTHHLIDALPMLYARNGVSSMSSDADAAATRGVYAHTLEATTRSTQTVVQYGGRSRHAIRRGGDDADVYKRKLGNGDSGSVRRVRIVRLGPHVEQCRGQREPQQLR